MPYPRRGILATCLLVAVLLLPSAAAAADEAPSLPGVDLSPLTPAQQQTAMKIFRENGCTCGCNMKVAECRLKDPNCTRSPVLAAQVVTLLSQGKAEPEVVKAVFPALPAAAAAAPAAAPVEMVFNVPVGGEVHAIGPESAPVTLVTWLDYQWPYCARVGPTLTKLAEAFPDDLRIVYKQLPLAMHFWAQVAAEAAMAAGAQGKFFEFDELVFARQREIGTLLQAKAEELGKAGQERSVEVQREVFADLAATLGLDAGKVRADLESGAHVARVKREAAEAASIGVNGTPGSFVNGRYLRGAQPFEAFQAEVQKEVDWAKQGNRPKFAQGTNIAQLRPAQAAQARGPDPDKVYPLQAGDAPYEGTPGAKVTLLHYLDYQWPYCARVGPTLEKLLAEYPKDLKIVYKMHPLPNHTFAQRAAQAAVAAQAQGKFADMHGLLFQRYAQFGQLGAQKAAGLGLPPDQANSAEVQDALFTDLAAEIDLDLNRFLSDYNNDATKKRIAAETQEVMAVGAGGTPASFVNGKYLGGAQPFEAFKASIDAALGGAATAKKAAP